MLKNNESNKASKWGLEHHSLFNNFFEAHKLWQHCSYAKDKMFINELPMLKNTINMMELKILELAQEKAIQAHKICISKKVRELKALFSLVLLKWSPQWASWEWIVEIHKLEVGNYPKSSHQHRGLRSSRSDYQKLWVRQFTYGVQPKRSTPRPLWI